MAYGIFEAEGNAAGVAQAIGNIGRSYGRLGDLPRAERAAALNNLAYLLALEGSPESLAEADAHSESAYDLAPMLLAVRSTRAFVLQRLGRAEEALWLTEDHRYRLEANSMRAEVLCTAALAYAQLGKTAAADASIEEAERLAADDTVVIRTRDAIVRSSGEIGATQNAAG